MLDSRQKRHLRALAHTLHPVVTVGSGGLTDAVLAEVEANLTAHELIKVRVHGDEREERLDIQQRICAATGAEAVAHIGKILIFWRPGPKERVRLPG